jgi:hypothetical protein
MNLPEPPSTFRAPTPAERPWSWKRLTAAGEEVEGEERFASQGDAETWIGESWRELLDAGVTQVVLLEHDREVYGPMSLEA